MIMEHFLIVINVIFNKFYVLIIIAYNNVKMKIRRSKKMIEDTLRNTNYGWQPNGKFFWDGKAINPKEFNKTFKKTKHPKEITNANLSNINMRGMSFPNTDFSETDFSYSNLSECKLTHCIFINCNFHECKFINSNISSSNFYRADMSFASGVNSNFNDSIMRNVKIEHCDFTYSTFFNVKFEYSSFKGSKIKYCNFKNTSFMGANTAFTNFWGSTFENSNLDGCQYNLDCNDFNINLDDKLIIQRLFHVLKIVQYSELVSNDLKEALLTPKLIEIANQFHRKEECCVLHEFKKEI